MTSSNKIKHSQLGMPFGTAMSRLRKQLLFKYVSKANENNCFKCGHWITDIDDFSIEHKNPWLHTSIDLFWDLDNIAFSHLKCNKPDRPYHGGRPPREIPEGMNWCYKHKEFLPTDSFVKSSRSKTGYKEICKDHHHYYRVVARSG